MLIKLITVTLSAIFTIFISLIIFKCQKKPFFKNSPLRIMWMLVFISILIIISIPNIIPIFTIFIPLIILECEKKSFFKNLSLGVILILVFISILTTTPILIKMLSDFNIKYYGYPWTHPVSRLVPIGILGNILITIYLCNMYLYSKTNNTFKFILLNIPSIIVLLLSIYYLGLNNVRYVCGIALGQMDYANIFHILIYIFMPMFYYIASSMFIFTLERILTNNKTINSINSNLELKSSKVLDLIKQSKFDIYLKNIKFEDSYLNSSEYLSFTLNNGELSSKTDCTNLVYFNNEEKLEYINDIYPKIAQIYSRVKYSWSDVDEVIVNLFEKIPRIYNDEHTHKYVTNLKNHKYASLIENKYYEHRFNLIKNLKESLELGIEGEKSVNKYLELYSDEIINLPNIRLEVNGESTENDNILITKKGIFILEVKNIGSTGSYNIKIEKDGRWIKQFTNGKIESIDFNATVQNDIHVVLLKRFLNNKLNINIDDDKYLNVEGIVVIANNEININNESNQPIFRTSEIYRHINSFKTVLTAKEMKDIQNIILKENLPSKKYPIPDYKKEITNNIVLLNSLEENIFKNEKNNLKIIYNEMPEIKHLIHNKNKINAKKTKYKNLTTNFHTSYTYKTSSNTTNNNYNLFEPEKAVNCYSDNNNYIENYSSDDTGYDVVKDMLDYPSKDGPIYNPYENQLYDNYRGGWND